MQSLEQIFRETAKEYGNYDRESALLDGLSEFMPMSEGPQKTLRGLLKLGFSHAEIQEGIRKHLADMREQIATLEALAKALEPTELDRIFNS
jgi:hypothetical protein